MKKINFLFSIYKVSVKIGINNIKKHFQPIKSGIIFLMYTHHSK